MATTEELQKQAEKDSKIMNARELFFKRIEKKVKVNPQEICEERNRIIKDIVGKRLKEEKIIKALKPILIKEPDCKKECPDHEYLQCECRRLCVGLFRNFWKENKEGFTDAEKKIIASKYNNRTGFLDINTGCRLPRKLRPYLCMRVTCEFLSGKGLEKYKYYKK